MSDPKLIPVLERCAAASMKQGRWQQRDRKGYIERFMEIAWPGGFFGWEHCALDGVEDGPEMWYLNSGDTYCATIIVEGGDVFVSSWGDWYETKEQEHCEQEDVTRCGYCGSFTPNYANEDGDIRCESCGRNTSTGEPMKEIPDDLQECIDSGLHLDKRDCDGYCDNCGYHEGATDD